jgi:hypothetical protein
MKLKRDANIIKVIYINKSKKNVILENNCKILKKNKQRHINARKK